MTAGAPDVRPGSVNAHTHLYSGLVPLGMPPPAKAPESFLDILKLVWWRLDRALDEGSLRASARYYIAEGLLSGTTTFFDHHESPTFIDGSLDVLAEEAEKLGARLFVAYGATERNGGRDEAKRGLRECARFIRENKRKRVRGMIGLHASFTVSDETIREAGALAEELDVPVHVHVAEAKSDVTDAKARRYAGPLERLLALWCLPARSIVAHGVWLDAAQVRAVDDAGAWLVQNPRSNAHNRVGYPTGLYAATRVALGTDGFPASMKEEILALATEALKHRDRASAQELVARCRNGRDLASLTDEEALLDEVQGEGGDRPREVRVGGDVVVKDGVLVHGDIEEITAHAKEQATRLWARMNDIGD